MVMSNVDFFDPIKKRIDSGRLSFWAEWEPSSKFELHSDDESEFLVHAPICDLEYTGERKQNTDPFIFGDCFWYTNCKQKRLKFVRNLAPSSMVVFGSESSLDGTFLVDTVFVVGNRFSFKEIKSESMEIPKELKFATLDLMFGNENTSEHQEYGYYQGLMHHNNNDFFSFTPAKIQKERSIIRHERLRLDGEQFDFASMKKNELKGTYRGGGQICKQVCPNNDRKCKKGHSEEQVHEYWIRIIEECKNQGFVLGVKFPMPLS
jgi:hypothetical protein